MDTITSTHIKIFEEHLVCEEKSKATQEKYLRDIKSLKVWLKNRPLDKKALLEYKELLINSYSPSSVNSIISSLSSFFKFNGWYELKIKALRLQKSVFSNSDKELSKKDYQKLLYAAKSRKNERLYLLMQTICATGIRVSELKFITVEAIKSKRAYINSKGKLRCAFLPPELCKMLLLYIRKKNIKSGSIFISRSGKPLDRSNIWSDMKKLCESAGVSKDKVFPHNLRHLFARTYYSLQKDIVRLADILGHSSVNTTRIYTMETGEIHRKQIQKLGLLRC